MGGREGRTMAHASFLPPNFTFLLWEYFRGKESWQENCCAVWLKHQHRLWERNSDDTVLVGAFAYEETYSRLHSKRRGQRGKASGRYRTFEPEAFGVRDWSAWAPCEAGDEEAKEQVSHISSQSAPRSVWKLLLSSLIHSANIFCRLVGPRHGGGVLVSTLYTSLSTH